MINKTPVWYLKIVIVYVAYSVLSALLLVLGVNITSIWLELFWVLFNIDMLFVFASPTKKYEQAAIVLPIFFIIVFIFSVLLKLADVQIAIANTFILSFLEASLAIYLWIGKRQITARKEKEPDSRYLNTTKHSYRNSK